MSRIIFGSDWRNVSDMLTSRDVVILTDENVYRIYGEYFPPSCPVIVLEPGEKSKTPDIIAYIASRLLDMRIDREGFMLGIGGGVVSDIAGFMAAVYMRGIKFGIISTTLLSQVDASIGGKNGVNCCGVKNVLGTFNHPEFVICDPLMLKTLPEEEYRSGLSELVKAALVYDPGLISRIESEPIIFDSRDTDKLESYIIRAAEIKKNIVEADFLEKDVRRLLNFGHTFGHAAESEYGLLHGQAVAWGMIAAMIFSAQKGFLSMEALGRMERIIRAMNLLPAIDIDGKRVAGRLVNDKKKTGDHLHFVFLSGVGNGIIRKIPVQEAVDFIRCNS